MESSNLNHDFKTPGIWRRMACWLYEGMLLFAVLFIGDYLLDSLSQSRHGLDKRDLRQLFLFVLLGVYFVWFWSKGQTLAMKTWHLRLVDAQGRRPSATRATARYCLAWILLAGPALLALALFRTHTPLDLAWLAIPVIGAALAARLDPHRQWPHDRLLHTRVIRDFTAQRRP